LQDWLASGLDSGCGIHGGFHWLQAGLRSPGYPPRSPPAKCLLYCAISGLQGWLPEGVASQKNRSDAGDMPRCAPQHTFSARKEPENNGLGFLLSPVRSPVGPKKPSPPSHPVNRLPLAFRTVWTPIWIPVRTLGSTTASTHGILAKAKGRANPSAHSPHLAFGIAWNCCRCRRKKCCNTLESLCIQSGRDLGQRQLPAPPCRRAVAPHLTAYLLPWYAGCA